MAETIKSVVILANGAFPEHDIPVGYLRSADRIICCDGAVVKLVEAGLEPWAIVGDLDSVPEDLALKFGEIMHRFVDQDTNDLTKSVLFAVSKGFDSITILGATGLREDHTIGNILLLLEYAIMVNIKIVTDHGFIIPIYSGSEITTREGQQVSVFSPDTEIEISSTGLLYALEKMKLNALWRGTLNEATGELVKLVFESEQAILVFLQH